MKCHSVHEVDFVPLNNQSYALGGFYPNRNQISAHPHEVDERSREPLK